MPRQAKSHVAGPDYGHRADAHLLPLNLAYRRAPGVTLGRLNTPAPSVAFRSERGEAAKSVSIPPDSKLFHPNPDVWAGWRTEA